RFSRDWSSDVCSSDLPPVVAAVPLSAKKQFPSLPLKSRPQWQRNGNRRVRVAATEATRFARFYWQYAASPRPSVPDYSKTNPIALQHGATKLPPIFFHQAYIDPWHNVPARF